MEYKSHIDGLRALAVMPVVLFHLGVSGVSGGYVGVDIFFVISGFLITSILYSNIKDGRYSLLEFYKRRVLRILPALFVVLMFTACVSAVLLLPEERESVGKSIIASATFLANFFFWLDSGYFTAPSESKPLLHMWSLAVEEQFYIIAPPLMFFLYSTLRRSLLWALISLTSISWIGCILLTYRHEPSAFYLLPARSWELGLGACLAIFMADRGYPKRARGQIALCGLGLIVSSILLLDSNSLFPGWNAVFPCVGALLLIGWAEGNVVGRALSWAPFVWVGKISYSFYLWHWPLIVFWKIRFGETLSLQEMVLLLVASVLMGALSTVCIENSFRGAHVRSYAPRQVVAAGGLALIIASGVGFLTVLQWPMIANYPENVLAISDTINYRKSSEYVRQFRSGSCFIREEEGDFSAYDKVLCATVDPSRVNLLLIGDSHAAQYAGAFQELHPSINIMQATSSGCRPLIGAGGARRCTDMRDWIYSDLLVTNQIDVVVIGGRWNRDDIAFLTPTLELLKSLARSVVVIGPTVEYQGELPLLLARTTWLGDNFDYDKFVTPGTVELNELLRKVAFELSLPYIDVLSSICSDKQCQLWASDGALMQFDYGHLTISGARDVLKSANPVLAEGLRQSLSRN